MKVKFLAKALVVLIPLLTCATSWATDLIAVYNDALHNDPTFKKAQATWLSQKLILPLAKTSIMLPNVNLNASVARNWAMTNEIDTGDGFSFGETYGLSINQPIFNFSQWIAVKDAGDQVKASTANYSAAAQDLIFRVVTAYLNVLRAYDQLSFILVQKKSFLEQLQTAQQKFKVGLIAVTGVYDAQSSYDLTIASEISNRNTLSNTLEDLRAITGTYYTSLQGLRSEVPLIKPVPANIDRWVGIAEHQNYALLAAKYLMKSAKTKISEQATNRLPNVSGSFNWAHNDVNGFHNPNFNFTNRQSSAAINVNVPIFNQGADFINTRKAHYDYLGASDAFEFAHRDAVNQTRQAYLGVISGISQIEADRQSIKSAQNQQEATKAGYIVGTRTMVDVLNITTQLTQTQSQHANDQYNYMLSSLNLKRQAGILGAGDLRSINAALPKPLKVEKEAHAEIVRYTTKIGPPKAISDQTLTDLSKPSAGEKSVHEPSPKG